MYVTLIFFFFLILLPVAERHYVNVLKICLTPIYAATSRRGIGGLKVRGESCREVFFFQLLLNNIILIMWRVGNNWEEK